MLQIEVFLEVELIVVREQEIVARKKRVALRNEASLKFVGLGGRWGARHTGVFAQFRERREGFVKAELRGGHGALDKGGPIGSGKHILSSDCQALASKAESPEGLRELIEKNFFDGVGGLMFGTKTAAQGVEFVWIFAGQNELFRKEAMAERILSGTGFAGCGVWADRVFGVDAIDFGTGGLHRMTSAGR